MNEFVCKNPACDGKGQHCAKELCYACYVSKHQAVARGQDTWESNRYRQPGKLGRPRLARDQAWHDRHKAKRKPKLIDTTERPADFSYLTDQELAELLHPKNPTQWCTYIVEANRRGWSKTMEEWPVRPSWAWWD